MTRPPHYQDIQQSRHHKALFHKFSNWLLNSTWGWAHIAYLLLFAFLNIELGHVLVLKPVTAAGNAGVVLAAGLSICHGLRRMWLRRMDRFAIVVQAQIIRVETIRWLPGRYRPYRLTVKGREGAGSGRVFRSGWISPASGVVTFALERLNVLIDATRPSRYFVDIRDLPRYPAPQPQRLLRGLRPFVLIFMVFYAEDFLVSWLVDTPGPPQNPVRGEVHASGPDFGDGVNLGVNACRMTDDAEIAAAVFESAHAPFPQASIIRSQHGDIGAFEVKRGAEMGAIRFDAANCSRIRGDIRFVTDENGLDGLLGYADAECVAGQNTLSIHVDFRGCEQKTKYNHPEGDPSP